MPIDFPVGKKAKGRTAVAVGVTKPATPTAASLATDLALAGAGKNVSCFIYGKLDVGAEVTKGVAPSRLCDSTEREQFGSKKNTIGTINLVWDPEVADVNAVNAAKALFADGAELWLYIRRGKNAKTEDFVTTDRYELRHVRIDGGRPGESGDDDFGEFSWLVEAIDLEDPVFGVLTA